MAIIYSKTTATVPEQCLVLGTREALVYPFDVGTWNDLRIGVYLSMVGSGPNDLFVAETVENGQTILTNNGFFGLKDSGALLPLQTGTQYIGWGITTGAPANGLRVKNVQLTSSLLGIASTNFYGGEASILSYSTLCTDTQTSTITLAIPSAASATGLTNYATFFGFKFTVNPGPSSKNLITGRYYSTTKTAPYTANDLRLQLLNTPEGSFGMGVAGYLTNTLDVNGTNVARPNSVFIYLPFFNNRVRIHALVVEKIS